MKLHEPFVDRMSGRRIFRLIGTGTLALLLHWASGCASGPETPDNRDLSGSRIITVPTRPPDLHGPEHARPPLTRVTVAGHLPAAHSDDDGDGVPNLDDNCPMTPKTVAIATGLIPTPVDICGCPLDPCENDEDKDGVDDCRDLCPGTLAAIAVVDDVGCPMEVAVVLRNVRFDFDSAELRPESIAVLTELAAALVASPRVYIEVEGHTSSEGGFYYNLALSHRRAGAVNTFLVEHGVAPDRLQARGYGESKPVASNATEAGRQLNRRVEVKLLKSYE